MSISNIEYQGVMTDARLNFKAHMKHIFLKASNVREVIKRMMAYIGGPRQHKRKIVTTIDRQFVVALWSASTMKSIVRKISSVIGYVPCAYAVLFEQPQKLQIFYPSKPNVYTN